MEQQTPSSDMSESKGAIGRKGLPKFIEIAVIITVPLLGIIAIAIWWTSRNQTPPPDYSLITGTPCGPPCWYGVTPGVTAKEELTDFLKKNRPLTGGCVEFDNEAVGGVAGVRCSRVLFTVNQGTIVMIGSSLLYPLTLSEVISKYGVPEGVLATLNFNPTIEVKPYAKQWITLFYPRQGFSLLVSYAPPVSFVLDENTKIDSVSYFSPTSLEDLPFLDPQVKADLRPWHGYGTYECVGLGCP